MLIFAVLLFAAVLISCRAEQTVLSTAGLFLVAGLLLGKFSPLPPPSQGFLYELAEISLFAVLFSDGMRTGGLVGIRAIWQGTGRALLLGMPLTIGIVAVFGHLLLGFRWPAAFLIGSALAPTDPVFVSAIFEVRSVPEVVKRILNVESGLNDGLALPAVVLLISAVSRKGNSVTQVVIELVWGFVLGVAIPWIAIKLEQSRFFGAAGVFERLNAVAIGLLVYAIAHIVHGNPFIAAFTSGITVVSIRDEVRQAFREFGEPITELLKLLTLMIFAVRVSSIVFSAHSWRDYLFVAFAVFVARLLAILVSFLGSRMEYTNRAIIGWFGPKGFASVIYGLMILQVGGGEAQYSAELVALAVAISIFVYSSTDVLIGEWLDRRKRRISDIGSVLPISGPPN